MLVCSAISTRKGIKKAVLESGGREDSVGYRGYRDAQCVVWCGRKVPIGRSDREEKELE